MMETRHGPGNPLGAISLLPIAAVADFLLNDGRYIEKAVALYSQIQEANAATHTVANAGLGASPAAQFIATIVIGIVGTALAKDWRNRQGNKTNRAETKRPAEATPTGVGAEQRQRRRAGTFFTDLDDEV